MELMGMNRAELTSLCERLGQPSFRGGQIADWLYKKSVRAISRMPNLPAALREKLAESASLTRSETVSESKAADGTRKFLLGLSDGETIESVLIPYADRTSVCVSTQVGCPVGCLFCATADSGFMRNLTAGEIVDQVLTLQDHAGVRVTHVVFMGMGEPLLNLENVLRAVRLLTDEVGISARRLTISTVGLTPAIKRLADMNLQLTLAISLHAPDDALRRELIPLSRKYPLAGLISTCSDYANRTKRRVTFEYLLLGGVNDAPEHAHGLARLLKGIMCHVNLIPYNEAPGKPYKRPPQSAVRIFRAILEREGIEVTQRIERGHTVEAACGQLRRSSTRVYQEHRL